MNNGGCVPGPWAEISIDEFFKKFSYVADKILESPCPLCGGDLTQVDKYVMCTNCGNARTLFDMIKERVGVDIKNEFSKIK